MGLKIDFDSIDTDEEFKDAITKIFMYTRKKKSLYDSLSSILFFVFCIGIFVAAVNYTNIYLAVLAVIVLLSRISDIKSHGYEIEGLSMATTLLRNMINRQVEESKETEETEPVKKVTKKKGRK